MKTNYELLKKLTEEVNKLLNSNINVSINTDYEEDLIIVNSENENIAVLIKDNFEAADEPIMDIITTFYTENERAKSKEIASRLKGNLKRNFNYILKCNDEEKILEYVKKAKEIKEDLNLLEDNLNWTKSIAHALYTVDDLYEKRISKEVV